MSNYLDEHQDIISRVENPVELITSPLKHIHIPMFRGLVLSTKMKVIDDLMNRAFRIYATHGSKYTKHLRGFGFKSGTTISFDVIHNEMDVLRYGVFVINYLGLYDASDFTDFQMIYLLSRSISHYMEPYALAY